MQNTLCKRYNSFHFRRTIDLFTGSYSFFFLLYLCISMQVVEWCRKAQMNFTLFIMRMMSTTTKRIQHSIIHKYITLHRNNVWHFISSSALNRTHNNRKFGFNLWILSKAPNFNNEDIEHRIIYLFLVHVLLLMLKIRAHDTIKSSPHLKWRVKMIWFHLYYSISLVCCIFFPFWFCSSLPLLLLFIFTVALYFNFIGVLFILCVIRL